MLYKATTLSLSLALVALVGCLAIEKGFTENITGHAAEKHQSIPQSGRQFDEPEKPGRKLLIA